MSETPTKSAYCPSCTKNVPHHRLVTGAGSKVIDTYVGRALSAMRIGPWYCQHCDRRRLLLLPPRKGAQDYCVADPLDQLKPGVVNIWSPASPGDNGNGVVGPRVIHENASVNSGQVAQPDALSDKTPVADADEPIASFVEELAGKPSEWSGGLKGDRGGPESSKSSSGLAISGEFEGELAEASSKDSSTEQLPSTKINRVSEKYRDSIVDRILAGKVMISDLSRKNQFSEAELVSWIADRFERMRQQLEELPDENNRSGKETGPAAGGFGPFGAR